MNYLIIIVCLVLAGCSSKPGGGTVNGSEKDGSRELAVIDITKTPEKIIYIDDIADVEYVPLETNDNALVSSSPDAVSEKHIVYHNKRGQVMIFDRQGRLKYSFNRTGGGPEEYAVINGRIVLDEERQELYIASFLGGSRDFIGVYSISGEFKRKLFLPPKFTPESLMNYDENYLFLENGFFSDRIKLNEEEAKKRDNPYFFMSKQTGELIPLDYHIPNRMGNTIFLLEEKGRMDCVSFCIYPLVQNASDIWITEFADDTLYRLKDRELIPIMVKKPSAHKMEPPMMVGVDFLTDRYVFIQTVAKKIEKGKRLKSSYMVYDWKSNEFYQLRGRKHLCGAPLKGQINLPHNVAINVMDAEYLLGDYEAGRLEGELKEIASKLKEDDNPVLMLIKFKE